MENRKKRFFTNHAKSSAMVVSLAVHAVLLVVALSFVAVTVIKKDDQKFESRQVSRPKMELKKLRVPVKIKKKRPKPRLRKQITVKARANHMPEIKMPEIVGIKGGVGSLGADGLGGAGGVGFSMPEIELFGIKSKGEKIFLILDSSPSMMYDEMGGIPAYTIIKEELIRIVESLPATTLFNVSVFSETKTYLLFPAMVSASSENVARVGEWLKPLNAVYSGMGSKDYGVDTLGKGGVRRSDNLSILKFQTMNYGGSGKWFRSAMISMQQQADAVFLLTNTWGWQGVRQGKINNDWANTPAGKRWFAAYEKGKKMLEEENKKRSKRGRPPRVIADRPAAINQVYSQGIQGPPPAGKVYLFSPKEFFQAFVAMREKNKPSDVQTQSGITKKKSSKRDFSLNVIQFVKEDAATAASSDINFKQLTGLCKGDYRTVAGLSAIKSYVGASK